ncbi:hypothetical protein KY284_033126 [Solanum tuberosum]|nr:hypothetical protein KY284_033126 [Solanum tuberosum]
MFVRALLWIMTNKYAFGKSMGYGGAPTVTLQLAEGIQLSVELDVDYSYSAKINLGVVFDFFTLRDVAFAYGGYNVV